VISMVKRSTQNAEQKKVRRRGGKLTALSAVASGITRPIFSQRGMSDGAIIRDWTEIVGTRLAEHSAPEKITYPSNDAKDGTLRLRVDGSGLAIELQHLEPVLIEKINVYFGYRAVARLAFIQAPLPEKEAAAKEVAPLTPDQEKSLKKDLSGVTDENLLDALESLGKAVIKRRSNEP
jgi:hypothetical protein